MTPQDSADGGIQLGRILAGDAHAPVVYFLSLHFQNQRAVKIGTSARLRKRIGCISYGATLRDILLLVPGDRDTETAYHRRFRRYQIQGEVFRLEGALRAFIAGPAVRPVSANEAPPPPPPAIQGVTLREALDAGVFGSGGYEAIRKYIQRMEDPPIVTGIRGSARVYAPGDLTRVAADRRQG
jgi:hypothetical protein